jgi:catechol 2,3-dioxygenase-like lactoylglutathione lyase family enzyme
MTEGKAPRAEGVLETCLYADDLDTTARFYEDVLGLRPFSRVSDRHVFFRAGPGVFLLFNPERTAISDGDVPPHGARGPGHVAFAVPSADLERWKGHLADLDVPVEAEVDWPAGGSSLYLRDPAGNSVELTTPSIWSIPEQLFFGHGTTGHPLHRESGRNDADT